MAEGYLRYFAGDHANIYSAGIEKHGVNPMAIASMEEDGIDISNHTSNNIEEYQNIDFDYLITVCDHANEHCPITTFKAQKFHHNFLDPSKVVGTDDEIKEQLRMVRSQIKEYCRSFIKENIM